MKTERKVWILLKNIPGAWSGLRDSKHSLKYDENAFKMASNVIQNSADLSRDLAKVLNVLQKRTDSVQYVSEFGAVL